MYSTSSIDLNPKARTDDSCLYTRDLPLLQSGHDVVSHLRINSSLLPLQGYIRDKQTKINPNLSLLVLGSSFLSVNCSLLITHNPDFFHHFSMLFFTICPYAGNTFPRNPGFQFCLVAKNSKCIAIYRQINNRFKYQSYLHRINLMINKELYVLYVSNFVISLLSYAVFFNRTKVPNIAL